MQALCFRAALFGALLCATAFGARAQQITIAPGSLVLTDAQRSGEILVANTEARAAAYRVEPVLFRMKPDGLLEEVGELPSSAAALLRFAPRQFELAPGGSQVVRVAFRATPGLAPGEYRLHLRMRHLGAPVTEATIAAHGDVDAEHVSARIPITVARAARVLVRHRVGAGSVGLDALATDGSRLRFALAHRGDGGSVTGTVTIEAEGRAIAKHRFSVYADLARRDFDLPLPAGVAPSAVCVSIETDARAAQPERRCAS